MNDPGAQPEDRKLLFRAVLWSLTAFLLWTFIARLIWPTPQPIASPSPSTQPGVAVVPTSPGSPDGVSSIAPPPSLSHSQPTAAGYRIKVAAAEQTYELGPIAGTLDSPFRMYVTGSNRGAVVETVHLSDYSAHVKTAERYLLLTPGVDKQGKSAGSFVVETLFIDEQQIDLGDALWNMERRTSGEADVVEFSLEIVQNDAPIVRLVRRFTLPVQPSEYRRYDFFTDLTIENLDDRPHNVRAILRGPVGIAKADTRFDDRGIFTAMAADPPTRPLVRLEPLANVEGRLEKELDNEHKAGELLWAALGNKFFTATLAPVENRASAEPVGYLKAVDAVDLDEAKSDPLAITSDVTLRFITHTHPLAAKASLSFPMECYLGPKSSTALDDERNGDYRARNYYGQIPASYNVGMCAFMTPIWLVELMLTLLGWFTAIVFNYGVAIILLVLVVRTLLHPLTKRTQVNMMKMQERNAKLMPKIEELKKRFANDKARLAQEQMKLMQEEGINPAGQLMTCLPMFVQMPIWIALYTSLSYNIDMRHQPFFFWIHDLTAPDALVEMFAPPGVSIPLLSSVMGPVTSLNILPLLLAVAMYMQQKLMPKPEPPPGGQSSAAADQAAQMQKMMPFMSIMFAIFMYNMPSGLTLYIMASTVFGTLEQMHIRKHIKDLKARGQSIDKPKGDGMWRRLFKAAEGRQPGLWDKLQRMAEDAKKQNKEGKR